MARQAPTSRTPPAALAGLVELRPPGELCPHPQAVLLPQIRLASYRAFQDDIERRGLLEPLAITEAGVVLDGHLRLRAAGELGLVQVPVRIVAPPDEVEYLLLAALQRRDLSPSQKAAVAVELDRYREAEAEAKMRRLANLKGQPAEVATLPPRGKTRDRAAAWSGVSPRMIQYAVSVRDADPELFEQVKQGKLPAERAARQVQQRQRDAAIAPPPPLPEGPFDLVYGDPAWRLPGSPDSSRAVENHYPTMELAEILALRIPASENAILFLWGVNSMVPQAVQVIEAWGFTYLTNFAWLKDKIGLGQYNRCQHELLHVGRRGNFPPPPSDRRFSSVIEAARGRHSAKPAEVAELLERMYPRASKLELFARGPARPGWTCWGNQSETAEQGS